MKIGDIEVVRQLPLLPHEILEAKRFIGSPSDDPPSDDPPSDESPSDESPSDESPSDESPSDDPPSDELKDVLIFILCLIFCCCLVVFVAWIMINYLWIAETTAPSHGDTEAATSHDLDSHQSDHESDPIEDMKNTIRMHQSKLYELRSKIEDLDNAIYKHISESGQLKHLRDDCSNAEYAAVYSKAYEDVTNNIGILESEKAKVQKNIDKLSQNISVLESIIATLESNRDIERLTGSHDVEIDHTDLKHKLDELDGLYECGFPEITIER